MRIRDGNGALTDGFILSAFLSGIMIFIMLLTIVVRTLMHYSDDVNCGKYAHRWHVQTRFVDYGYWGWDCLTKTSDGWYPIDKVRIVK